MENNPAQPPDPSSQQQESNRNQAPQQPNQLPNLLDLDPRLPPDSTSPTGTATVVPVNPDIPTPPNPNASGGQDLPDSSQQFLLHREPGDGVEGAEGGTGAAAVSAAPAVGKKPSKLKRWSPNPDLIDQITSLGFTPNLAEKALFYTGNRSADQAVGWILDHPEAADDPRPLESEGFSSSGEEASPEELDEEDIRMLATAHKMVFVVNSSLKMGLGKIAAQVGHATIGLYKGLLDARELRADALAAWDAQGEMKVVLRGNDQAHLVELAMRANQAHLPTYLVQDAGRTQIAPGSVTVLGLFGPGDEVDQVTGQLKLL